MKERRLIFSLSVFFHSFQLPGSISLTLSVSAAKTERRFFVASYSRMNRTESYTYHTQCQDICVPACVGTLSRYRSGDAKRFLLTFLSLSPFSLPHTQPLLPTAASLKETAKPAIQATFPSSVFCSPCLLGRKRKKCKRRKGSGCC